MFGAGSYFCLPGSMKYSADAYAEKMENGERRLIIARVAAGRMEHKRPTSNLKGPTSPRYQSVTGTVQGQYKAVITYERHCSYPAYIIDFR